MNKSKPKQMKSSTSLVRNAGAVPKQSPVFKEPTKPKCTKPSVTNGKAISAACAASSPSDINLSVPQPNSSNIISKEIRQIKGATSSKLKSVAELDSRNQLAFQEKITRKMNFPIEHAVYKNLIPVNKAPSAPVPVKPARDPLPMRDPEPVLSDYIQPATEKPRYMYEVPAPPLAQIRSTTYYDGFSLFRTMKNWNL